MWTLRKSGLEAMARLGSDESVCGIALVNVHWAWTGGYTWLHRDVPITVVQSSRDFHERAPGFNAVLVDPSTMPYLQGFAAEACWPDLCIARRPGPCAPLQGSTINAQLERSGV